MRYSQASFTEEGKPIPHMESTTPELTSRQHKNKGKGELLRFVAHVNIKGHIEIHGLCWHWEPCVWVSGPALARAVLASMACFVSEGYVDDCGLCCSLEPCFVSVGPDATESQAGVSGLCCPLRPH